MVRIITHNRRHIWKMPILAEQHLRKPVVKLTGYQEDIFTNAIEHKRLFNPYAAQTKVNAYHADKQDKMLDQQINWISAGTNMADGRQDHDKCYEVLRTEIMKSSQRSRSGEIRTRSWHISHKLERLGIDQ